MLRQLRTIPYYFALIMVAICSLAPYAQAATDGGFSFVSSTGTANITITIPKLVRIRKVNNFNFGTYAGVGDLMQNDNVCVWTNVPAGTYYITATGDGGLGAFTLAGAPSGDALPYTVKWNDETGTAGNIVLTTTVQSPLQTGGDTASQNCGGGNTANVEVILAENNLRSVSPSIYTGVLTLLIEPS